MSRAIKSLRHKKLLPPRIALVGLAAAVLLGGVYFARKSGADPQAYSNDFNVYYFAAREVMAGRDPYTQSLGAWTPYLYPPLLAESLIPLALLPLQVAAYVWFLISAACALTASWLAASMAAEMIHSRRSVESATDIQQQANRFASRRALIATIAFAIVARFALDNFNYGQVNTVVAALAVAHVYFYATEKKAASAFALALAISIKLTPAIFILYHVARLRLKFAAFCLALLAALTVLSFAPFGASAPDAVRAFVDRTIKNEQGFDLAYSGNQSLRGAVARMAGADESEARPALESNRAPLNVATLVLSLALLALAFIAALVATNEMARAAPFFCCLVLLSPLSWKAHFVVLIFPAAYLIGEMFSTPSNRFLLGFTLAAIFALFNLTSPRLIGLAAAEWSDTHSLVFAGGLLTLFASVRACAQVGAVWQASRRLLISSSEKGRR